MSRLEILRGWINIDVWEKGGQGQKRVVGRVIGRPILLSLTKDTLETYANGSAMVSLIDLSE